MLQADLVKLEVQVPQENEVLQENKESQAALVLQVYFLEIINKD